MPIVSSNVAMGFSGVAVAGKCYGRQIVPEMANHGTISQEEMNKRFGVDDVAQGAAIDTTPEAPEEPEGGE